MDEVFRTNDPVELSFVMHVLAQAGIEHFVADQFMSAVEGNIGAFPRRVMVPEDAAARARVLLASAVPR